MFVIKTEERKDPRRVVVFRDDTLHVVVPWDADHAPINNHRNAALKSLLISAGGDGKHTPHHILGAAPMPGEDFWVVAVEEGE